MTQVVLYETFARRAGHAYYPATFTEPRRHAGAASLSLRRLRAQSFIPDAQHGGDDAPGDRRACGRCLVEARARARGSFHRSTANDDYHPNENGAYLSALVFFGTLYESAVSTGLPALGIDEDIALELQGHADAITGAVRRAPAIECPRVLAVGDARSRSILGPTQPCGWASVETIRESGRPAHIDARRAHGHARECAWLHRDVQTGGSAVNSARPACRGQRRLALGWLLRWARSRARPHGDRSSSRASRLASTRLSSSASRDGNDGGNGRLTRYAVGTRTLDLEVGDNQSRIARFDAVTPNARGTIAIEVSVSPEGRARFAYAGMLRITRVR